MCVKSNLTDEKKKWRDNKMTWIKTMFGTEKAIIGLLHLKALPGDPFYEGDMKAVIKQAETDLEALQAGGVDGILITNEFSLPYEKKVSKVTVAAMARVVGAIEKKLKVPYGVEVIYDADATIEVCAATGADFSRCVFTGAFAGDLGIVDKDIAKTLRLRRALASGLMIGLKVSHTRAHIYKAALEGIAYTIEQHIEILEENNLPVQKIMAVGGGTKNQEWLQIIANVTGKPIHTSKISIGASYGDALMASLQAGFFNSWKEIEGVIQPEYTFMPDEKANTYYEKHKDIFKELYELNKESMHKLRRMENGK